MDIRGGIQRSVIATWRFISPTHWYNFHRLRSPVDADSTISSSRVLPQSHEASVRSGGLSSYAAQNIRTQMRWRAPQTRTSTGAVPTLSLICNWTACKELEHPEMNEDAAVWSMDSQLGAVFDGATESFAAQRWVKLVSQAWLEATTFDLAILQRQYEAALRAIKLSWAQEQAAGRGSFTTLASIKAAPGGLAATCVGDSAILLVKDKRIVEAYPSMQPTDYSSVPDALSSDQELVFLGEELLESCSWTIPVESDEIDTAILATDAVAVWLLQANQVQANEHLAAVLEVGDTSAWEQLVASEREAGRMKPDDSTVMMIAVKGAG